MCESSCSPLERSTEVQNQDSSDRRTKRGDQLKMSVKIMTRRPAKVAYSHEQLLQEDHHWAVIPVVV